MASYVSLTLPFCHCFHQSDGTQNDPSPHIHTLTQTCHSSGMRGMHMPPREWSPSIQWAELPTVECTLRGSKCVTPTPLNQPPQLHTFPQTESRRRATHFKDFVKPPPQHPCPHIAQSWIWNSSVLSDVGRHDEVYTLTLSDFKGTVLVWSAQERDGFTAGDPNLCRETFAQVNCRFVTHLQ